MIRGEKREIVHPVNATINAAIHNRFDVEVVDSVSGEVKQKAVGYNVICNSIWAKIVHSSSAYFNYIQYGGGNGTPSASDTSLFDYIGGASATNVTKSIDRKNGVYSYRKKIQLSPETAVGETITEVGIAHSGGSSGNLVTHAMLQDMNGNRISITKSDTDVINIYATVFVHFSASGWDGGSIFCANDYMLYSIAGGSLDYIYKFPVLAKPLPSSGRGSRMDSSNTITNGKDLTASYDVENRKITFTAERLSVSEFNNYGGIGSILISTYYARWDTRYYDDRFSSIQLITGGSWYPGTQITGEAIGTGDGATTDFATDFPLVSNATVKVNGAAASDVTVDMNVPREYDDFGYGYFLNCIMSDGSPTWEKTLPTYQGSVSYTLSGINFYENPYYASCGIASIALNKFTGTTTRIYVSNDLSAWTLIKSFTSSSRETYNVPSQFQNYRYWKLDCSNGTAYAIKLTSNANANNIHFSTPPVAGAVITADYFTKTIAKDENHVFDLTVTIQLGEYSEV